jgi:hypothetical protein
MCGFGFVFLSRRPLYISTGQETISSLEFSRQKKKKKNRVRFSLSETSVARWHAHFQTKNTDLGKFWKVLQWKMLAFLWPFCLFNGQMVYFMAIWYILGSFGNFSPFWYVVP